MKGQIKASDIVLAKEDKCFAYLTTRNTPAIEAIENIIPINNEATCEPDINCNIISSKFTNILARRLRFVNIVFPNFVNLF